MQTIDLSMLISGGGVTIQPHKRDYGVQQIEEAELVEQRQKERSFFCWVTPQKATTAGALCQSEARSQVLPPGLPCGCRAQTLGPSSTAFPGHSRAGLEEEQLGQNRRPNQDYNPGCRCHRQRISLTLDIMQGANNLKAKVNIEVQMASELAIAAIEKNGGVVTTAFYDPRSLEIPCIPVPFFLCGQPIPKQMLTRTALVPYYTDAKNHGYPADRAKFPEARLELTRKYGYVLPDIIKDELFKMLVH
ncbi:uncharacterized protein [Oryctolagus cuniculus]|uniref:uncharacterized protein isoform X2 n=1 Tax=Oryctolagus cuniculus TaxID=9986 RepID=UPI003879CDF0